MTRLKLGWCWVVVLAMVGSTYAGETENPSDTTETQTSPLFESVALPYEGHASVAVLNNGLVAIEIGEETFYDEDGEIQLFGGNNFYLAPDMTDLRLIETDAGEWFLVNAATTQIDGRIVPFDENAVPSYETARESLLSVEGEMSLDVDAETDTYCLGIHSEEEVAFSFHFRAASVESGQRGCDGPCNCNAGPCPKYQDTCHTSCTNKCCLCYCDGPTPICKCTRKVPKEIVVPKDADSFPPA